MPFLKTVDAPLSVENSKGMITWVTNCSKRSDSTVLTCIGFLNDGVSYLQGAGAPTYHYTILAQRATYKSSYLVHKCVTEIIS
jgi:hypothetical protein